MARFSSEHQVSMPVLLCVIAAVVYVHSQPTSHTVDVELRDCYEAYTQNLNRMNEKIQKLEGIIESWSCYVEREVFKNQALISGSTHRVPDTALSSSSNYLGYANHGPQCSRLGVPQPDNCWTFAWTTLPGPNEWIQVDLGTRCTVESVATQGRGHGEDGPHVDWVTSYTLAFGSPSSSVTSYMDPSSSRPKVFAGNTNPTTVVRHYLIPSILAQTVRLNVIGYSRNIAVRWELYGYHSTC